jgi:Starch-binding associating with outer membrane
MAIRKEIIRILPLCTLVLALSCSKQLNTNLHDTNGVAINALTGKDVFPQALSTTVQNKSGLNIGTPTPTDCYDYATQWMQYWARTTSFAASGVQVEYETFDMNNSFGNGIWQSLYHNIYDYNFVLAHSTAHSILPGASMVMRAMLFQELVDQFGNIPFTQACQPAQTITPAYDSATTIYRTLVLQIDSAIQLIQASQSTPDDQSDIMFNGSPTLWTEFANTIKLRILLRQVPKGDQSYVSTNIGNIIAQGSGFLQAGQDALVQPGYSDLSSFSQNPFWADYGFLPAAQGSAPSQNNDYFVANTFMINFLDSTADPRLGYFYTQDAAGSYGGNEFGNSIAPSSQLSSIGPGILQSPGMPALLFSASQSFFMQAEAVQRGLLSGDYQSLYKQGVEESFRHLGVTGGTTAADNFIAGSTNGLVNIAVSSNPLQTILYQKWVAECELDGLEAYSDYRRTGFPSIPIPSYSAIGIPMPKRLLYPESEYTQNAANVNAQHQSPSDLNTKIFWGL